MKIFNKKTMSVKTSKISRKLAALSITLTVLAGLNAKAIESISDVLSTEPDGSIIAKFIYIDLSTSYCPSTKACLLSKDGIQIKASYDSMPDTGGRLSRAPMLPTIVSNIPIKAVEVCYDTDNWSYETQLSEDKKELTIIGGSSYFDGGFRCEWLQIKFPVYKIFTKQKNKQGFLIRAIHLVSGYDVSELFRYTTNALLNWYTISFDRLVEFEGRISRPDRRHLTRLKSSLADAINGLKDPTDKTGKTLRPITSDSIREQARMVMVLTTVLSELLLNYDDIPELKNSIGIFRNLNVQLRVSYGWQNGLSGAGSKSLASLAEVIDIELRDLGFLMGSFGNFDATLFNRMITANRTIKRIVTATNGGDAEAIKQVKAMAELWNKPEWQTILSQLLNAPQDYLGLVQPKLKLLLMAIESMSDFTDEDFDINDDMKKSLETVNVTTKP